MKSLLIFFVYILILLLTVSFALGASYMLPYPWSKVNIVFVVLLILLIFRPRGAVVWMAFLTHFFLELYATTPFGVLMMSGTISMLLTFWGYQYIFSNRSWYAVILMSLFTLLSFRTLYIICLWAAQLIDPELPNMSVGLIAETVMWEIFFTVALVAILYVLMFSRKSTSMSKRQYGLS